MFVVAVFETDTHTLCERRSFPLDDYTAAWTHYQFVRENLGEGLGVQFFAD
jgi:hypothetical protein